MIDLQTGARFRIDFRYTGFSGNAIRSWSHSDKTTSPFIELLRRGPATAGAECVIMGISEVLWTVSRETQAERNQPCRESCCRSPEISTNVPTFDARRPRIEDLSNQAFDFRRMRRGVYAPKAHLLQFDVWLYLNRAAIRLELGRLPVHGCIRVYLLPLVASVHRRLKEELCFLNGCGSVVIHC